MSIRPIFYYSNESILKKDIDFLWIKGLAVSQKQKNIDSFHKSIKENGFEDKKILEVSTKSKNELGIKLSAFNLRLKTSMGTYSVEQIFQSSKVFEYGGPFKEILDLTSREAKKFFQDKELGNLISFNTFGKTFSLEPKNFFYNWIYIQALVQNKEISSELLKYDIFTDIEFNPKKSYSTQASAIALYCYLVKSGNEEVTKKYELYEKMFKEEMIVQERLSI